MTQEQDYYQTEQTATHEPERFSEWAILEIMGHQRYGGLVSEYTLAGASFIRIDIPALDDQPAFTKLFSPGSVYAITPTTEQLATAYAKKIRNVPISAYDLPEEMRQKLRQPLLPAVDRTDRSDLSDPTDSSDDDDEYYDEEDDDGGPF
jgi:hypothetical protein